MSLGRLLQGRPERPGEEAKATGASEGRGRNELESPDYKVCPLQPRPPGGFWDLGEMLEKRLKSEPHP